MIISDLQNGTFGCTYWGCYAVLTFFSAFALCGVLNQKAFMNIDEIRAESVDETGDAKGCPRRGHNGVHRNPFSPAPKHSPVT